MTDQKQPLGQRFDAFIRKSLELSEDEKQMALDSKRCPGCGLPRWVPDWPERTRERLLRVLRRAEDD